MRAPFFPPASVPPVRNRAKARAAATARAGLADSSLRIGYLLGPGTLRKVSPRWCIPAAACGNRGPARGPLGCTPRVRKKPGNSDAFAQLRRRLVRPAGGEESALVLDY